MISRKNYKSVNKADLNVAILGPTGYTGHETIRMLIKHPRVKIKLLIGNKSRGKYISDIFSSLSHTAFPKIESLEEAKFSGIDVIFSCMPSGNLTEFIHLLPKDTVIIDLSADFRIKNIKLHEKYYGKHKNKKFISKFTYGLSELDRKGIKKSNYIACPGCYPTSILLPILPLINNGLISMKDIIVDSKSGISGAGRNISKDLIFCEVNNSFKGYGSGNHRHAPEIEDVIYDKTKKKVNIIFTPHLIPINRGILSTIYLKGSSSHIQDTLIKNYKKEKFIKINRIGELPKLSDVIGSNICKIGVLKHNKSNNVVIFSVIDNLIKGASGQAIQNMNLIFNFPEDLGLDHHPFWP
jgi:N-acetyl-gamma-glutamyl-phosphate reductase